MKGTSESNSEGSSPEKADRSPVKKITPQVPITKSPRQDQVSTRKNRTGSIPLLPIFYHHSPKDDQVPKRSQSSRSRSEGSDDESSTRISSFFHSSRSKRFVGRWKEKRRLHRVRRKWRRGKKGFSPKKKQGGPESRNLKKGRDLANEKKRKFLEDAREPHGRIEDGRIFRRNSFGSEFDGWEL
jgi:hypothetical protein